MITPCTRLRLPVGLRGLINTYPPRRMASLISRARIDMAVVLTRAGAGAGGLRMGGWVTR